MQITLSRQPFASPRRGVAAWGLWLLRWSLVLLLIVDQVGAPLHHHHHHHHHDAGADGAWPTASLDHAAEELVRHVEDADHADHFSHSTLMLRGGSESVKVSPTADDDVVLLFRCATALALLAAVADDAVRPPPGWRSPFINAHRSLPPASRAPPLHA